MTKTLTVTLPKLHAGQRTALDVWRNHRFMCEPAGRGFGKSVECNYILGDGVLRGQEWHYGAPDYARVEQTYRRALRSLAPIVTSKSYCRRITTMTGGTIRFWTLKDETAGQSFHPTGGWIIDESGLVGRLKPIVQESIMPSLNRHKAKLLLTGTPKGHNDYYHFWNMARGGGEWGVYTATSYDNPYQDAAELDNLRDMMTDAQYRQEILAEFLEDGAGVFRNIRHAIYGPMTEYGALVAGQYAIGVDLGKVNDFTVFTVIDIPAKRVVYVDRQQGDYSTQVTRLADLTRRTNASVVKIESNSVGQMFIEQAHAAGLPVVAFTTTNDSKTAIINRLQLAFEAGEITIPDYSPLVTELMAFEAERLPAGSVRYSAPEGQHDDCVMSLAIAWDAARVGRVEWGNVYA